RAVTDRLHKLPLWKSETISKMAKKYGGIVSTRKVLPSNTVVNKVVKCYFSTQFIQKNKSD
ncbi:MAG: hypothetical protein RPU15_01290, partial [Candidatus Sedimenticola sp. (ex Thyasira tokunagai)]